MRIVLVDHLEREALKPFTFLRPVSHIRIGIMTIAEKWESIAGLEVSVLTVPQLQGVFSFNPSEDQVFVNASLLPDESICATIKALQDDQVLINNGNWLAARITADEFEKGWLSVLDGRQEVDYSGKVLKLNHTWDIFRLNGEALKNDYRVLTEGKNSEGVPQHVTLIGRDIFIEKGAILRPCTINTEEGPVYIAANAEVMEGVLIRGGLYLGEHAQLKMGAKIYGPTTIGPHCKVGGEVNNSVFFGYSNKAHDGFVGNSVISEWCNLGADTNTSNLKNNYSNVRVYSFQENDFIDSGLQFCGLMMGDHSKCSINTMFNTGTTTGIFCNVFGSGFPPKYIPSFSWGGNSDDKLFEINKAVQLANRVMERRSLSLDMKMEKVVRALYPAN